MTIKHVSTVENASETRLGIKLNQHVGKDYKRKYVPLKIRQTIIVNAEQVFPVIGAKRPMLAIQ